MGVARLREERPVSVRWLPFPLHPEIPEAGLDLQELFAGRGVDVGAMMARLRRVAAELDLPLGERTRTYNSRRAQELGEWAETLGTGEEFRAAVFRAYFVEGRNIGLPDELTALARGAGLDAAEARKVLVEQRFGPAVDRAWARARQLGVAAVPTHRAGGRLLSGLQSRQTLASLVDQVDLAAE